MSAPTTRRWRDFLTNSLLIVVLLTCVQVWIGVVPLSRTAEAQIPNAGLDRRKQIEEQKITNGLLTEIRDLLRKETLTVKIEKEKGPR